MQTWALILLIAYSGKYGQSSVVIPGYATKQECMEAATQSKENGKETNALGFCVPGPAR